MRGLFLLLLLSNLVFLAVLYITGTPDAELDPYRNVKFANKGLTLLSELPPEKRPSLRKGVKPEPGLAPWPEEEDKGTQIAVTDEATKVECWRVDGIRSQAQLQSLRQSLEKLGTENFQKGGEVGGVSANSKFWVMLPPYSDLNKATEAAAALKSMQIKDFFVIRSGEYKNAVSLGVFSSRERAKRRQTEIARLKGGKWKAKIEQIGGTSTEEQFWLSFRLANEASPAKIRGTLHKQGLSQIKEIGCK